MSELRKENLLARIRILQSFGRLRRVDSDITRLLIVDVSSEAPSNVMVRSLEHAPTSRQKDNDALESMYSASGNVRVVGLRTPILFSLHFNELQRLRTRFYQLVLQLARSRL